MSKPIDFGICNNRQNVYSILTWCEGEDANTVLTKINKRKQYEIGVTSGKLLHTLHSFPAPMIKEDWSDYFNKKINYNMQKYKACGIRFSGDDTMLTYVENHRHLLIKRPQSFQHGDYHTGNMVIDKHNNLSIIDFNRFDFGDPWEEFNRIVWSAAVSPHFATGQLDGYFNGTPPIEFFKLLALYICSNTLNAISWAKHFGQVEIDTMIQQSQDVLVAFDYMQLVIPTWYLSGYTTNM